MNDCGCGRETTLREEIERIEFLNPETKQRMLKKCEHMEKEIREVHEFLERCHGRIDTLERTIVRLSVHLNSAEESAERQY